MNIHCDFYNILGCWFCNGDLNWKYFNHLWKLLKNRKGEKVDLKVFYTLVFHDKLKSLINIMKFKYLLMLVYFFDPTVQNIWILIE